MSLFGSLTSGVSGLTAQSSAMGAIADNITNVNTVGYKGVQVDFQTLVTVQTSTTFFNAGGVQSSPRQDTGIQGLLQASTSSTDIAISGNGFFVVNEANRPTINNEFLFTRAGSFFQDNEGFLRNTSGFFLQGWPTDASGNVTPANTSLTVPNQNVISTDFLTTVNLNRVGGTATATRTVAIGANLPANDTAGTTHKTDVQFFDTLGNANTTSLLYTKGQRDNQWDLEITPPQGVGVVTLYQDTSGSNVYESRGQLEFTATPNSGSTVVIDGITYQFSTFSSKTASLANPFTFTAATNTISATAATFTGLTIGDSITIAGAPNGADDTTHSITAVSSDGSSITVASLVSNAADTDASVTINDQTARKIVDISATGITTSQAVSALVTKVKEADTDYKDIDLTSTPNVLNNRIQIATSSSTTVFFTDDGTGAITVDPLGLRTAAGLAVRQEAAFTVKEKTKAHRDEHQFTFPQNPTTSGTAPMGAGTALNTITINSIVYEVTTAAAATGTNRLVQVDTVLRTANATTVAIGSAINNFLVALENAIEAADPEFSVGGTTVRTRKTGSTSEPPATDRDTLVLSNLQKGSYNILFDANFNLVPTEPDGSATVAAGTNFSIDKTQALTFNSDGLPSAFGVAEMEILGYANGAADMDDGNAPNSPRITLDFGRVGEANGFTQFGASFTPVFIQQDGSQFGNFAGVTIANDGLMTALFDNGETRPVFKLPIATFVNVNALGSRTGNVWNQTQGSGDPTLREANNGPSGQVVQSSLESSTVDIGSEFTKMIVVQRAFSAATKIISTADEMLEELVRIKR